MRIERDDDEGRERLVRYCARPTFALDRIEPMKDGRVAYRMKTLRRCAPLPRRMTKKQIIRIVKERWHTEQAYSELKGELGLDHFEGRSFPGWHHHVSVVLCCYAFVVSERVRRFPPSGASAECHAIHRAA